MVRIPKNEAGHRLFGRKFDGKSPPHAIPKIYTGVEVGLTV
jgi:hypothetical protein